jgi:branched-chain amino acid transport system substrate-binding protein
MEDLTGIQLGQYRIVAPLGEGGMAAVYKAYQPGMERYVALKILPRHFAADPEFNGRFEQEAKLVAKLQHVHILPVHDFGEQDGYTYIVMPFIETGTLADLMEDEPLPIKQVRSVTTQVGQALGYADKRGLIHRDIKPSNILIDEVGNCLLTDFGIAKIVESSVEFTRTGAIIGTPAYMSPEQIKSEQIDGRSDQYSLGVVLFEMATGRAPYKAETPPAIFVKHLHDPLPMPRELNPEVSQDLEQVILKCLAKDPVDRYANMEDMLRALRQAIPDRPVAEPAKAQVEPAAAPTVDIPQDIPSGSTDVERKTKRIPAWGWAVGTIAVLGILGAIGALVFPIGSATPTPELPVIVASDTAAPARPTALPTTRPTTISPTNVPFAFDSADSFVCEDTLGCVIIGPDEPVRLAYMLTLSGNTAFLGQDSLGGIEIAVDDWGGVLLGHPLELAREDSGCSVEGGLRAAQNVVADPTIVGVIGTSCSSAMNAAMSTISEAGLLTISPSNTLSGLTLEDRLWQPGYYRVAYPDFHQGLTVAQFAAIALGAEIAATIHGDSAYSIDLQAIFTARFEEMGGTVSYQGAVRVDQADVRSVLAEAAATNPDVLFFPVFEPTGPRVVRQAAEFPELNEVDLITSDSLLVASFPENAGENAIGMYLSAPYVSGPQYDVLMAKWGSKFGSPPPSIFHAFAYDATNLLLDVLEKTAIQAADGSMMIGRQALREALSSTSDFQGVTGRLDCRTKQVAVGTSHGDCGTEKALGIFQITAAEVHDDAWPPDVVWTPSD